MTRCRRCAGNAYHDALEDQWACLQCGWRAYATPLPHTRADDPPGKRAQAARTRKGPRPNPK